MPAPTLGDLRRHAIARTLSKPTALPRAIQRLGFVRERGEAIPERSKRTVRMAA